MTVKTKFVVTAVTTKLVVTAFWTKLVIDFALNLSTGTELGNNGKIWNTGKI